MNTSAVTWQRPPGSLYAYRVRSSPQPDSPVADSDPRLAGTVRLLHRRRGWAWTAIGGFLAFLVASSVYSNRVSVTGSGPLAILVLMTVLGALTVIGLVIAIVDSVLLGRRPAALREQASAAAAHHPLRAHAYRYPPRHLLSWVATWLVLVCVLGLGVLFSPGLVNGVSYLADGNSVTFVPQSWQTSCTYRHGCMTITDGILETGGGGMNATWPDQVPLNHPFLVREPVWKWGLGEALIDSDRLAVITICLSLLFIGFSVCAVVFFVKMVRNWLRHRRRQAA